jgi:hypothetical protein
MGIYVLNFFPGGLVLRTGEFNQQDFNSRTLDLEANLLLILLEM